MPGDKFGSPEIMLAVIDGPYDAIALSKILARLPISSGNSQCELPVGSACQHGAFILGLLGARRDTPVPGLCPDCRLLHIPLFSDDDTSDIEVSKLATAIDRAVEAGARLINLSLSVVGSDNDFHSPLGLALDRAHAAGVLIVTAAGNQGQVSRNQLVSHPATIPVVAADAQGRILPFSNLSPEIARRGVAAFGSEVLGYAAGGGTTRMSGTSVAAAVVTGILAAIFRSRPNVSASDIRTAVGSLGTRHLVPPLLDYERINVALDAIERDKNNIASARPFPIGVKPNQNDRGSRKMQMNDDIKTTDFTRPVVSRMQSSLSLAGASAQCSCGAPGGVCTCPEKEVSSSGFVYAIGTIEADYPNVAVEREMLGLAQALLPSSWHSDVRMPMKPTEDRSWQHAVLNADRKMTRYIARQLTWRLTIEDFPVFVLKPQDPSDIDGLIDCLSRPKYPNSSSRNDREGSRKDERRSNKRASTNKEEGESIAIGPPYGPPQDLDVVVGVRGASTPDGIEVLVDQIFTIPPERLAPDGLAYFPQLSDNYGLTDADRAYNFLAARYKIQNKNLDEIKKLGLVGVPVISSRLSGDRGRVVKVIFTLRGTERPVEAKYFIRVDVTHKFPVLVTPWQRYLERGE